MKKNLKNNKPSLCTIKENQTSSSINTHNLTSNRKILKTKNLTNSLTNNVASSQQGKFFGSLFFLSLIFGMIIFTFYVIQLDKTITNKFEGKRWNIPAKVYSRPLELYKGADISSQTVSDWLKLLNYRKSSKYQQTGTFHKANNTYYIHTRGFKYSNEEKDAPQIIKLHIHKNKIDSVQSTIKNKTGIVRLEPTTIGGIYPDNNEDRVIVTLEQVPKTLIDALVATEDRGFYQHYGVSVRGIARAVINNLSGKAPQGGSTLTQQLVKNFYLSSERSLKRKVNEALMSILLEIHYDKNTILETYLNEITLGQNGKRSINGFGLASQFYFNRPLNELSIDQQALLVGLAKGSSYYNPRRNPNNATQRRNTVLHNMLTMGKLSQEDYQQAIKQPLGVVKKASVGGSRFPAFLDLIKRELNEVYYADDLKNEGLRIISTLDPLIQASADKAVSKKVTQLRKASKRTKNLQGALVSANPKTGELLAVVGGVGGFTGFNRAIDAKRQVGSLLKPVIYLNALESGKYNLASPVTDAAITITMKSGQKWSPKNYGKKNHGKVALTTALAKSYNQAAVRVGLEFGIDDFIHKLHLMGIEKEITPYPSVLLGTTTLNPMDMLSVYQVFATGGMRNQIHTIRSVVDDQGRVLQRTSLSTDQSIDPKSNYLVNYALQQVVKNGTAKQASTLGKHLDLAGKTGTTNDYRDAWFAGYSGNYVSVVWVGNDDNKPIGLSGSNGALPVWIEYMKHLQLSPVKLEEPKGIEWLWLENNEGKLSIEECANAKYLPVLSKYKPTEESSCIDAIKEAKRLAEEQKTLAEEQKRLTEEQKISEQRRLEGLTDSEGATGQPSESNNDNQEQNTPNKDNNLEKKTDSLLEKVFQLF